MEGCQARSFTVPSSGFYAPKSPQKTKIQSRSRKAALCAATLLLPIRASFAKKNKIHTTQAFIPRNSIESKSRAFDARKEELAPFQRLATTRLNFPYVYMAAPLFTSSLLPVQCTRFTFSLISAPITPVLFSTTFLSSSSSF